MDGPQKVEGPLCFPLQGGPYIFLIVGPTSSFGILASGRNLEAVVDVRFGSKADMCAAKRYVRFTPESGHVRCS